jgi:hypothetical protein
MRILLPLFALLSACTVPMTDGPATRTGSRAPVADALCRLGFRAVPLRTLPTGHHLVEVQLNGRPGTFVLDTGAGATVLHAPLAQEFGVTGAALAQGGAIGLGGSQAVSSFAIESFTIGEVPTRLRRVATLNLGQVVGALTPLAGRPVHGVVGQDVLAQHRAVIDVRAPAVYLMEADADPAPVRGARCR